MQLAAVTAKPAIDPRRLPADGPRLSGPTHIVSGPAARRAPTRLPAAVYWRRRLVALAVLIAAGFVLTVATGRVGAQAGLGDPISAEVVIEPGQTLWEVAASTAPDGVDTREQLAAIRALNGLDSAAVAAWTVVAIPAR